VERHLGSEVKLIGLTKMVVKKVELKSIRKHISDQFKVDKTLISSC